MSTSADGELAADLAALRSGAATAAGSGRTLLVASGADRVSFLQGMLSNDVARLGPGEGCRALLLDEQGHLVAEMGVLAREDAILLDVASGSTDRVRSSLERFVVADDVEIAPTGRVAVVVRGPGASRVLARAIAVPGDDPLARVEPGGHLEIGCAGRSVIAVRDGDGGFLAWAADEAAAAALQSALRDAGAREVSAAALEADRVARGLPSEGVDLDDRTLAPEVPALAGAISYRKGCYLGQEVVERVAARGKVNWLVTGLRAGAGSSLPSRGALVRLADREVGRVSSAVRLPGEEGIAMLARIRREAAESGATLRVEAGAGEIEAVPVGRG
jgi:folate-binding protein YgfZ